MYTGVPQTQRTFLPSLLMTGLPTVVDVQRLLLDDIQILVVVSSESLLPIWTGKNPFFEKSVHIPIFDRCLTRSHVINPFFCKVYIPRYQASVEVFSSLYYIVNFSARFLSFGTPYASSSLPSTVYIVSASTWNSMPGMFVNGGRTRFTASYKQR